MTEGTDEGQAALQLHSDPRRSPPALLVFLSFLMSLACCVCVCCLCEQKRYKSVAREHLRIGCNELRRPEILTALYSTTMGSKVNSQSAESWSPLTHADKHAERFVYDSPWVHVKSE